MGAFSLDHLSDVRFEEFCFDLLVQLGAYNVNWRTATGLGSSSSDEGRDFRCIFTRDRPDGSPRHDLWFVECKYFREAVSPAKIQGALAWADAEKPNVLLLIASNTFSTSCKVFLKLLNGNNRPRFKIRLWELNDLERLARTKPDLLRKYGLTDDFPFLRLLHPVHVRFLREPPLNTLNYFFSTLEKAGAEQYKEALYFVSAMLFKQSLNPPPDFHENMRGLHQSPITYNAFRDRCYELGKSVEEAFLVRAIVNEALWSAFDAGNKTSARTKRPAAESPVDVKMSFSMYASFCQEIVAPLFDERTHSPSGSVLGCAPA